MNRREQLEQLYLRLACLEDLNDQIENLAGVRQHLSERVNTMLTRLNSCREERQRLTSELENFNDVDQVSVDFFRRDGQLCQLFDEVSECENEVVQLGGELKVMAFEISSLDESVNDIEVEIESLNRPNGIRTNPSRGH
jgi:chromosome segregation ATPase